VTPTELQAKRAHLEDLVDDLGKLHALGRNPLVRDVVQALRLLAEVTFERLAALEAATPTPTERTTP
jgi:hypothetical protein